MNNTEKVAVLWTSGDVEVAEKVVLMYTKGAKMNGWFEEIVLVVWGPSTKLLATNVSLQNRVKELIEAGVKVKACSVCAGEYNVTSDLENVGLEVIPMGPPLTDYLKTDWRILSF
ncbi:DsrE family protein [Marinilabilia rubra]|uniref:DsrE family protein n=1 Tax=Marinilabilia rubra TaxID=2162893 RepID=A0A2U2B4C1_9BACT|nr:DsrE family protein [Marinilabilia rubra]PWD97915.1 DsrE family protein [Marinilabilia rubra]